MLEEEREDFWSEVDRQTEEMGTWESTELTGAHTYQNTDRQSVTHHTRATQRPLEVQVLKV